MTVVIEGKALTKGTMVASATRSAHQFAGLADPATMPKLPVSEGRPAAPGVRVAQANRVAEHAH